MPLKPAETYPAGGVDSRSNPITMPVDRCLEVHDFWPQQDGSYRLRDGYTLYATGLQPNVPIHSVTSVTGGAGSQLTTTTDAISSTGIGYVNVVSTTGLSTGQQVVIDSGGNKETVTILDVAAFSFEANFTKTHLSGVAVSEPPFASIVIFWQNTTPYVLDQTTHVITSPTVKGAAIASNARFSYFYANGHLHAFNGTDAKWFDGTYWRDIGLPTLTPAQAAAITFLPGLEAITPAQAAAVTLAAASGGSWPFTAQVNVWLAFFDLATNTLAASATSLGTGPVSLAPGQKIALSGLPSSSVSTAVALLAFQNLPPLVGPAGAVFCSRGNLTATAASALGSVVTLTIVGHGLTTGAVITFDNSGPTEPLLGPYAITVVNSNQISFVAHSAADAAIFGNIANSNNVVVMLTVPNGTTTASISSATAFNGLQGITFNANGQNLFPFANDTTQISGLPASSIGGPQPGYQFYACIYNLVTGHVGNRTPIGFRLLNTATIASLIFSGCPIFADSEWVLLLGRTSDGAEIPYTVVDQNANWQYVPNGQATFTLFPVNIDGNSELPSRNYPPPGTLDYNYQLSLLPGGAAQNPPVSGTCQIAWLESDHCCGALVGSPTIYRSGSALDDREGVFVGLPEQSWDPADIETFPTNNLLLGGHGYQGESWCFTNEDCAILMELAGETSWQGPYNVGIAGQHAWTRGWQNLPFWITGEKQLATISLGGYQQLAGLMNQAAAGPILISAEYEAALLANIGDNYLSQTEISYIRKPLEMVEVLRIKCFDSNGTPFTVIHDFNLRDDRSPYGQAYEEIFVGPLASSFTQATIRDQNNKPQVLAGGADGKLYKLYSGSNDFGSEFTAQALRLIYVGPQRTAVKFLEWYGDRNAQWFMTKKLNSAFNVLQMDNLCQESPLEVQGQEGDSHWSVEIPKPEMVHVYLLLQLKSHSADGSAILSNPPHMPVETYGRIWLVAPQLGASRPR
jgi:hypothetical protein